MSASFVFAFLSTPIGPLRVQGDAQGLHGIAFSDLDLPEGRQDPVFFASVLEQLRAYFDGRLRSFDLPLAPAGTPFQQRAWAQLQAIPFGKTITYGEQAKRMGDAKAMRAVGGANGRNPWPIVVPCHRVVAANGGLGGYSCGLERKQWLIEHEQRLLAIE